MIEDILTTGRDVATISSRTSATAGSADTSEGARALRLIAAAAIVGVTGDLLLRGGPWRLGFALWMVIVVGLAAALFGAGQRERRWMLLGLTAAAAGLAGRDLDFIYAIDLLSVLSMGALIAWLGTGKRLADLNPGQAVRAAVIAPLSLGFGAPGALQDALQRVAGTGEAGRRTKALVIGAALAVPPLLLVLALLANSDIVFGDFLERIGNFVAGNALQHVVVAGSLAWLAAGWLRVSSGTPTIVKVPDAPMPSISFLMASVGLYGLVALLALFLATQARVLFGGADYLRETVGLTVAAYARNGFFEMVAAAGVVLATIVVAEWLLAREDAAGRKALGAVGTVLLIEVGALLASALTRMGLYLREFGLSVDRAFALAVMAAVAAVLVVVARTTLRGRGDRFGVATFGVAVGWVVLLNVANLEAIVVRWNVARAEAGAAFDGRYHGTLSADALPALVAAAPRLSRADCLALSESLAESWAYRLHRSGDDDLRARSLSLVRAYRWLDSEAALPCAPATRESPPRAAQAR